MAPPLIQLSDIALTFGGTPLLDGVELAVSAGERVCLVGRNGSGKSTLLKIAAGLIEPDRGKRFVQPGDDDPLPAAGARPRRLTRRHSPMCRPGSARATTRYQARYLLEQLGLDGSRGPGAALGRRARGARRSPTCWRPRPTSCCSTSRPTISICPPSNGSKRELDRAARRARADQPRPALPRKPLAHAPSGSTAARRGASSCGFATFEAWRDEQLAEEELDQHKLDRKIVAEEHWVRYGVTGAAQAQRPAHGATAGAAAGRAASYRGAAGKAVIDAAQAEKSGALVIEAERIAKTFGERPIVADFSTRIMRGDRIGIVGPNGSGKTTLVNLLAGTLAPDSGQVRLGANLEMATLEQGRDSLDPDWTLSEALTGGRGDTVTVGGQAQARRRLHAGFPVRARAGAHAARASSPAASADASCWRARWQSRRTCWCSTSRRTISTSKRSTCSKRCSATYAGTVILISHDRDFLDRVVNAVIVPEGDGRWVEYAGGYADMLAQRGADLARMSTKPKAAPTERPSPPLLAAASNENRVKRKLSFHEKHALETLPATIAALEVDIRRLKARLDDPTLYGRDPKAFTEASTALATALSELAAAEEKWLALEIQRQEIEET